MPESRRSRRLVLATAAVLLLTVGVALAYALYQARTSELAEWRSQLSNTSLLLAQQTSNEMGAANLVLNAVIERIGALGVQDEAALRDRLGTAAEFQRMRDHKSLLPQIDVISIVGSGGELINFTRSHPVPPINLADREYFSILRDRPDVPMYVSSPVRNKGNGEWTFYLSRRISAPDGRFLGVALVGVSCRQLSEFFSKINLGVDATVTLYRRDFVTLARWPHLDAQMGAVNRGGSTYEIIERKKLSNGVAVVDTPRQAEQGRRVRRMGAARLIPAYPMIINVTVTENLFLAQWWEFAWQLMSVGGICAVAVALSFAILLREMRNRDEAVRRQRALKAEADAANRAKTDFLAMMSHEIRTPLTAVIGFAEQMEQTRTVQEADELGGIIARNGHLLLALINDILDMSKVESGKLELERTAFNPGEAMAAVVLLMRGQAERRAIRFESELLEPCPPVMGDPIRWRQILINLLSNAIKFTEQGGVQIRVWYQAESQLLHCRVRDTGVGMDDQQLARLFKPFQQADTSIARRFGGTGLGLYLVHQLAQAMGGTVSVRSEPGTGTTIEIAVHAELAETAVSMPTERGDVITPQQLSGLVLLVEDGEDNRRLISAILQRKGLRVLCAGDGQQGMALALSERPNLVLMDIQMPVLDGISATRRLRASGFKSPIVALTANVMPADRERYAANGFDGCLAKPIDRAEFERTMAQFLAAAPAAATFSDLPEFSAIREAFYTALPPRLDALRQALEAGDLASVQIEAHTLKGSAATFGCPRLGLAAAGLEQACRGADTRAASAAFALVEEAAHHEAPKSEPQDHS